MNDLVNALLTALPLLIACAVLLGSADAIASEIQSKHLIPRRFLSEKDRR